MRLDERFQSVRVSFLTSIFSKFASISLLVAIVWLAVPYLGVEIFGAMMAVYALISFLSFLDFGLGNALANRSAEAVIDGVRADVLSGGIYVLLVMCLLVGAFLGIVVDLVDWSVFIVSAGVGLDDFNSIVGQIVFLVPVYLFSAGIGKIYYGMQRAHEANISALLGSIFAIVALISSIHIGLGVEWILFAVLSGHIFSAFMLLMIMFLRGQLVYDAPCRYLRSEFVMIYKWGALFWVVQLASVIGWGLDSMLVAGTLGFSSVAVYAVVHRLCQAIAQPVAMINAPLWGVYAKAYLDGDKRFIGNVLRRSIMMTLAYVAPAFLVIYFFGQLIVSWLTRGSIVVDNGLVFAFGLWVAIEAIGSAFSVFLNSCRIMAPQVMITILFCFISIPLKIHALINYGMKEMILIFLAFYCACYFFVYFIIYKDEVVGRLSDGVVSR